VTRGMRGRPVSLCPRTPSHPKSKITGLLPLFSDASSGSGEMLLRADSPGQSQDSWLQSITVWDQHYSTWIAHARQRGELPESNSGEFLAGFTPDETTAGVRSNSRGWSSLAGDWNSAYSVYNMTYNEMCYPF
jgi:hypothetical protein